jgi:organic hydroperoxide reductase OsmC/OhrA
VKTDHDFAVHVRWQGNRGVGTAGARLYGRESELTADGVAPIAASAAKTFHGDATRWNPELLLIAALSECHMLSYLYLAARDGIVVTSYTDDATGVLRQTGDSGHFASVTLRPNVQISAGDPDRARALHVEAGQKCFIAASVNFPIVHEPTIALDRQSS